VDPSALKINASGVSCSIVKNWFWRRMFAPNGESSKNKDKHDRLSVKGRGQQIVGLGAFCNEKNAEELQYKKLEEIADLLPGKNVD